MQDAIHVVRRRPRARGQVWIGGGPVLAEEIVSGPLALGARTVASGERGGFVEEKQLGIEAGGHHIPPPALELQQAGDPAPARERAHDALSGVVQAAAAVTHQRAALGRGDQLAEGRDAILSGQ